MSKDKSYNYLKGFYTSNSKRMVETKERVLPGCQSLAGTEGTLKEYRASDENHGIKGTIRNISRKQRGKKTVEHIRNNQWSPFQKSRGYKHPKEQPTPLVMLLEMSKHANKREGQF